jgi:hypothetical protein
VAQPTDADTYTIGIVFDNPNAYSLGTITPNTLTISKQTVSFEVSGNEYTYDGSGHTAAITPSVEGVDYTVTYTNSNGETVTQPTDADTYTIGITLTNPNSYSLEEITSNTLTIKPQTVTFTVSNTTVPYDGSAHTATIETTSDIPTSSYTVQYSKDGVSTDDVKDVGEYEIVINITDSNYELASDFSAGTMTVTSVITLNIGNSPAAMIYKDESIEDKESVFSDFVTNHKFTTVVPSGCSADITYNPINSIDADGDINTVIVSSLADFTDPGLNVNGSVQKGSEPAAVEGVEGLYKVTYDDGKYERYVMVVGRIGDVNANGAVNAIDANYLDGKNSAPNGVTEARMADVNKDGVLDKQDASAIRYRYKTKLTSYYPWLEWTK